MSSVKNKGRFAGILILVGMLAGIFSVAPAVDSVNYLTEAAANANQVIIGACCQFVMALTYVGFAILLYPTIKRFGSSLSTGFLSMRIIAATLVIVGTILLPSILSLSQHYTASSPSNAPAFETVGDILKSTRDQINHVFMILILCIGNFMLYILLLKSKLIPRWLSVWGFVGNVFSAFSSVLVLFQVVEIITMEYLFLNVLTAVQELVLAVWLIGKGIDERSLEIYE